MYASRSTLRHRHDAIYVYIYTNIQIILHIYMMMQYLSDDGVMSIVMRTFIHSNISSSSYIYIYVCRMICIYRNIGIFIYIQTYNQGVVQCKDAILPV